MTGRLDGRVAVVTGGASGIGQAYAERLAADGASVAVLDITGTSDAALTVKCDVTDPDQVAAAAAEVEAALGPADILVNNAGIYPNQPFEAMTYADWRRVMTLNVDSMFLVTQAFLGQLKASGRGRIICMTSNSVGLVIPGFSHYIASKMAVIGLVRSIATELAEHGVTANAVGPSLTRTATTEAGPEIFFEVVPQMQAIKRLQVPADLTGTVAFLASDDAAFITGQTFYVDGGLVRAG